MADSQPQEVHIASFVLHLLPDQLDMVLQEIGERPDLEPGTGYEAGKLVLLAEGPDPQSLLETMEFMESLPGVLKCILVYHEIMTETEASQELIPHNNAPTVDKEVQP
ncbi:MAG: chaperone NapD [Pseudomonadota bacterium]